jgi:hypothetical protein
VLLQKWVWFSKAHMQCSKRESEKYKRKGYESFSFLPPHTDLPAPHMFGLQRPAELARELPIRRVTRRVSSLSAGRLRTRGLTRRVFFLGGRRLCSRAHPAGKLTHRCLYSWTRPAAKLRHRWQYSRSRPAGKLTHRCLYSRTHPAGKFQHSWLYSHIQPGG